MRRAFAYAARHPVLAFLAAGTGALALAFAVVAAGVIPITASSGHWRVTAWLLHFAMQRSVATHALMVDDPQADLTDAALILRGAGQFETGCRFCHGAPGEALPPVPAAMTPHPPRLGPRVAGWAPRELFYLVKHGVKFTGMPAWPTDRRDDEVWAMVAFLRRLPPMSAGEYERLVYGPELQVMADSGPAAASPPPVVRTHCARCHGRDGSGRGAGAFPKLAGQRFEYMQRALHAYGNGQRASGLMQPMAARVPEAARHDALRYYASLPPSPPAAPDDVASAARGAEIARRGVPAEDVPSCETCHTDDPVNPAYPRLAGQYRRYLVEQLTLLQQRRRGGSEFVHIMHAFVDRLNARQIDDVAAYFAAQARGATAAGVP
jgi:cytochrome c553